MPKSTIRMVVLGLAIGTVAAAVAQTSPGYVLRYYPARQIACGYASTSTVTGMQVKEYVFYQLAPPPTPRQHVTLEMIKPTASAGFSQGGEKLPLVFLRQVFAQPQDGATVAYQLVYKGRLCRTALEPLQAGEQPPKVPDLTPAQRKLYTAQTNVVDYGSPIVTGWLDETGLRRKAGESDLDFGRRVFLTMTKTFKYGGHGGNTASKVVSEKAGVCVGLSLAFAAAMRAGGVPCRVLDLQQIGLGGNYRGAEKGHANNEFFCRGIGWVPCDLTGGCSNPKDEVEALTYFGQDRGETLMQFNGADDFTVDTVKFGCSQPQPAADFRGQYGCAVPDQSDQFWGLMWTGNGNQVKYKYDDHFYARIWTDPAAYEKASPDGGPADSAANAVGFSVWRDDQGWHIRSTTDGQAHKYQISIFPEMAIGQGQLFDPGQSEKGQAQGYHRAQAQDMPVKVPEGAVALRFQLKVDGRDLPSLVSIGSQGAHPACQPFTMAVK